MRRQGHAFEAPLDSDDVDESEQPNDGSPNFYVTVPRDAGLKALAKLAVRFPTLGVKRRPEGAAAEADARGHSVRGLHNMVTSSHSVVDGGDQGSNNSCNPKAHRSRISPAEVPRSGALRAASRIGSVTDAKIDCADPIT